MTEKRLKLYFPSLVPRPRYARKWHCLKGYSEAPVIADEDGIKIVWCRFKARTPGAVGKRIIFFSDLHYSAKVAALGDQLCRVIKKLNADLLLCGGDLCCSAADVKFLPPLLDKLADSAPLCFTVPGNWERGKVWLKVDYWRELFQKHHWDFLCNEGRNVDNWGWVYGCDDIARGYPDLLEEIPSSREGIFLVHRPDTVIAVDRDTPLDAFTLALCGHTHGGQIRLPFYGAITAPSFYGRRLVCGLYRKEDKDVSMLVSTGVNHASFPWRINCRRELILIEFE